VGVDAATARVDPGAIIAMTTARKVTAAMVCLEPIPSRCRCPYQQTIIGRRTRGATKSHETSSLASLAELRLLCQISTSSSCRKKSRQRSPASAIV
jgi:hypothetical protein